MTRIALAILALVTTSSLASAQSRPTRFWNLTRYTVSEFYLAPAGTSNFGPNQCKNDKDGTVDHDERLRITGLAAGRYDAKVTDRTGRTCVVRNVDVKDGIFAIEEKQMTNCEMK